MSLFPPRRWLGVPTGRPAKASFCSSSTNKSKAQQSALFAGARVRPTTPSATFQHVFQRRANEWMEIAHLRNTAGRHQTTGNLEVAADAGRAPEALLCRPVFRIIPQEKDLRWLSTYRHENAAVHGERREEQQIELQAHLHPIRRVESLRNNARRRSLLRSLSTHCSSWFQTAFFFPAFCRHKQDKWYEFNDRTVMPVKESDVKSREAYILFFSLVDEFLIMLIE